MGGEERRVVVWKVRKLLALQIRSMQKMQQTAMLKRVCAEDDVQEKLYYVCIQKDGKKIIYVLCHGL